MVQDTEVVIVGAGIAGASLASFLSATHRVVLLEAESQPGYHSTGRSAAMFMESYGTPTDPRAHARQPRLLHGAAGGLQRHAADLATRRAVCRQRPNSRALLERAEAELRPHTPNLQRLDAPPRRIARVPVLRPDQVGGALLDPDAADIDVHALHQGFLRRAQGERRACSSPTRASRRSNAEATAGTWPVPANALARRACVVNAAGAWADAVARLAGMRAASACSRRRRAAFLFAPPAGVATRRLALRLRRRRRLVLQARRRRAARLAGQRRPGRAARRAARGARHRHRHRAHRGDDHAADPPPEPHLGRAALLRRRRRPGGRLRPARARLLLARRAGRLRHPDRAGVGAAVRRLGARRADARTSSPPPVWKLRTSTSTACADNPLPDRRPAHEQDPPHRRHPRRRHRQGSDARGPARPRGRRRAPRHPLRVDSPSTGPAATGTRSTAR